MGPQGKFGALFSALSLCALLFLTGAARCYDFSEVFARGHFYFADGDCYSRMTRVRMVMEHPFRPVHHHGFENYPQGTDPHTTAPMDYLIAFLACAAMPFTAQYLDFAGAVVSPLLGIATAAFLWVWFGPAPYRRAALFLFAVSPILVHGTVLGRPDHQSLLMFLLAAGLGAEWKLHPRPTRAWGLVSGLAWGLALWTSLYEPVVLFVLVAALALFFDRSGLGDRARYPGYAAFLCVVLLGLAVDGWPVSVPDQTVLRYFPAWEKTIGELATARPWDSLLYRWVGFGLIASPILLGVAAFREKKVAALLVLLVVTWLLTLSQVRWGYFFGLAFVMSLPWQLAVLRWRWLGWCFFLGCLWPVAREWDDHLLLNASNREQAIESVIDAVCLRDIAAHLQGPARLPVLAPWWFCPALAYWSGQPAVAGSSHESLPGIVDTARFYLSENPADARAILRARGVRRVVAYDPGRELDTAATLLGAPATDAALGAALYERPHSPPSFLTIDYENRAFKLYRVEPDR